MKIKVLHDSPDNNDVQLTMSRAEFDQFTRGLRMQGEHEMARNIEECVRLQGVMERVRSADTVVWALGDGELLVRKASGRWINAR